MENNFVICNFKPHHKPCQLPEILIHFNENSFQREQQVYGTTHNQYAESLFWSELKMNKSMIHHSINMRTHLCPKQRTVLCVCLSGHNGFDLCACSAQMDRTEVFWPSHWKIDHENKLNFLIFINISFSSPSTSPKLIKIIPGNNMASGCLSLTVLWMYCLRFSNIISSEKQKQSPPLQLT